MRRRPSAASGTSVLRGIASCALSVLVSSGLRAADAGEDSRPDIVLIVADDLGWGDVSFLDGTDVSTPAIDSIAADGAVLEDFHGAACVCTPSRYAMMTGREPWRSLGGLGGVLMMYDETHRDRGLRRGETTFAETLRTVGYDTMLAGKWHLGHGSDAVGPHAHGFDVFHGCRGGCIDAFTHRYATVPDWWRNDRPIVEEGEANDLIAAAAARFIRGHDRGHGGDPDPMLVVVSLTAPHYGKSCLDEAGPDPRSLVTRGAGGPRARPDADANECRPVNTIQAAFEDLRAVGVAIDGPAIDLEAARVAAEGGEVARETRRAHYRALVHAMDDAVAEILAALEAAGRSDAVVIFAADHGPDTTVSNAGDAGRWSGGKHGLREGGTRVPAAIRWRGTIEPGTRITQLSGLVDLHATFAAVAGAAAPEGLDGIDLSAAWRGDDLEPGRTLRWRRGSRRAVREGRWKWHDGRLYDLREDPREQTDVAAAHPVVAKRLRGIAFDEDKAGP